MEIASSDFKIYQLFDIFTFLSASASGWTQTLDLKMMRRVLYHYATAAGFDFEWLTTAFFTSFLH